MREIRNGFFGGLRQSAFFARCEQDAFGSWRRSAGNGRLRARVRARNEILGEGLRDEAERDEQAQVVLDDRHVVDSVATPQVRGNLEEDDVGETHNRVLAELVSEAQRDVGFRRAAPLLGGRVRNGFSAALGAPLLRHRCCQATFCEAVSSSARATTFALSGGGLESDAPEPGWQKLRENEGEIGYFLVKFGVELWGWISN